METSDAVAVDQARAGDKDAFRVLVERHSRALFHLAFRMTGNQADAEDVVQETFLRACRQLDRFDGRSSFSTWIYRIAVNCSLDQVRARKRRSEQPMESGPQQPEPASNDAPPDRLALSGEVRERVSAALDGLSPMERTAFVLRHFEGMRIEEVSRVLGVQPGAAKHSVFRAVQKLRRELEPLVGWSR